jgi:hypothetical protein
VSIWWIGRERAVAVCLMGTFREVLAVVLMVRFWEDEICQPS